MTPHAMSRVRGILTLRNNADLRIIGSAELPVSDPLPPSGTVGFRASKIKPRWSQEWRFLHELESPAQPSSQILEGVHCIRRDCAVSRQEVST
jgi:hypothetical protein